MKEDLLKKKLTLCLHGWKGCTKEELYKEIFEFVFEDCFRVALGILKSVQDAEDVTISTISYILVKPLNEITWQIYCGPNIKGYFVLATKHRSLNFLRDKVKRQTIELVEYGDYTKDSSQIRNIDFLFFEDTLEKAYSGLSEKERLVFVLKEIDGYSHREIVNMGVFEKITNSTSTLVRAKTKLKNKLKEFINIC